MFLINIKFHLDHSKLGYFTGLVSSPEEKLPSKFTIRVSRLTQAGYKVREVLGHQGNTRRTRTYYGIHFKLRVSLRLWVCHRAGRNAQAEVRC